VGRLVYVALALGAPSIGALLMGATTLRQPDRAAAEIAVMALRASVGLSVPGQQTWVLPDGRSVGKDSVIGYLLRAPKPLECEAALANGVVRLTCTTASFEEYREHADSFDKLIGLLRRRAGVDDSLRFVVVGGGDELFVDESVLRAWNRSYLVQRYASAVREPTAVQRSQGADYAYTLHSVSDMRLTLEPGPPN